MEDINNSFLRSLFEYCATIGTYKNILHSNSAGGGGGVSRKSVVDILDHMKDCL